MLTRLNRVLLGAVPPLVSALEGGEVFYGGDLAYRLAAANIIGLEDGDQRRLGLAIGRRAARETVNVRSEDIDACASDPATWPDAYREGVVQGLFLNEDGQVAAHPTITASSAVSVLQHHSDPKRVLSDLREQLVTASWSPGFAHTYGAGLTAMRDATPLLPEDSRQAWSDVIEALQARAPGEAS